jgi:hypothetical protein
MATITLDYDLNISIQPGDMLYSARSIAGQSGSNNSLAGGVNTKPMLMGEVTDINHATNSFEYNPVAGAPAPDNRYLFFAKDKRVNYSGIKGYYAETEYRNYTTLPAEIFATAVDYTTSSK